MVRCESRWWNISPGSCGHPGVDTRRLLDQSTTRQFSSGLSHFSLSLKALRSTPHIMRHNAACAGCRSIRSMVPCGITFIASPVFYQGCPLTSGAGRTSRKEQMKARRKKGRCVIEEIERHEKLKNHLKNLWKVSHQPNTI